MIMELAIINEVIDELEHEETTNGNEITGEFIISGDYKAHQISVNKEDKNTLILYQLILS